MLYLQYQQPWNYALLEKSVFMCYLHLSISLTWDTMSSFCKQHQPCGIILNVGSLDHRIIVLKAHSKSRSDNINLGKQWWRTKTRVENWLWVTPFCLPEPLCCSHTTWMAFSESDIHCCQCKAAAWCSNLCLFLEQLHDLIPKAQRCILALSYGKGTSHRSLRVLYTPSCILRVCSPER